MKLPVIRLQSGRHKRVLGGYPWIFSNEIAMDKAAKSIEPGAMVEFHAHDKRFLGKGSFNHQSLIGGRIFTRALLDEIGGDWLRQKLEDALALRARLIADPYYRLVHAEADGLPGLIIDRFDSYFSVQFNTAGMQKLEPLIEEALIELFEPESIILRNDNASRVLEGLPREVKVLRGAPEGPVEVRENGLVYFADLKGGQKTGWYFDQRDNRALVARYSGTAKSVLDLYCHAGGFSLLAAKAGAQQVTGIDSSEAALELARQAAKHNHLTEKCVWQRAEVFEDLERRQKAKERHDVVIADPPAFVKSRKDLASGARGYRKLARLCAGVTAPQGILFIASCSYNMDLMNFTKQVATGLTEAGRPGRVLQTVFAAPDHPMHPHLPESAYLKGLLIRLD